jgi:hypothetical protein
LGSIWVSTDISFSHPCDIDKWLEELASFYKTIIPNRSRSTYTRITVRGFLISGLLQRLQWLQVHGGKLAAEYRGKTSRFPLSGNDVAIAWSNPVLVSPWPWLHHRSWLRTKGCGLMTLVCTMVWPCANKHGQRLFL